MWILVMPNNLWSSSSLSGEGLRGVDCGGSHVGYTFVTSRDITDVTLPVSNIVYHNSAAI